MSQPVTETGRRLLARMEKYDLWHPVDGRRDQMTAEVAAIEREAVLAFLDSDVARASADACLLRGTWPNGGLASEFLAALKEAAQHEPKQWVMPVESREALIEKLARIMRDRAYPEFTEAPPPLWATDAAEAIASFYESIAKAAMAYGGADRAHRLLHSALRWMEWLEEPTLAVKEAWIAAAKDELGLKEAAP